MQSASAALIPASSIARTRSARSLTTAARASKLGPSDGQWGLVILAVPIGILLALMLLTRLITRTGARLLAVPRLWFCFSSHHWQHCPPLGYEEPETA